MLHRLNRPIALFLLCSLGLIAAARPAAAEVTKIEFTSKQPFGTFRAGDYVIWQGQDPRRPGAAGGHSGHRQGRAQ